MELQKRVDRYLADWGGTQTAENEISEPGADLILALVHGDFIHQACRAAWGPVNERLWIDADETERHRRVLDAVYAPIGVTERGRLRPVSRIGPNLCR
ncbi:hypothetical protein [Streptomyces sp. BE133]|uniref:hypothetical protein n=1 Tax=Streptomyces sp. BE133 TaxID=3002523 RepID=UPI002E79A5CB|nr:hypothetical protein [Streptomyces sp. BE133]MEE1805110.1 hypothetical protein [Streptomyces sp. BE133]